MDDLAVTYLLRLCERLELKPTQLAAKIGVSSSTITRPLSGNWDKKISRGTLEKAYAETGITPADLGVDLEILPAEGGGPDRIETMGFIGVPRFDFQLSGGGGRFTERAVLRDQIPFTANFIHQKLGRANADGLAIFEAEGSSMEPDVNSGDLVMVDRHKKIADGSIMAFRHEDAAYIKRVQRTPEGHRAWSMNPSAGGVVDTLYSPDDAFEVIGKAVWIGRML